MAARGEEARGVESVTGLRGVVRTGKLARAKIHGNPPPIVSQTIKRHPWKHLFQILAHPLPRPRGISIGGWEESSAMREIESIYIYIYTKYDASLSISKGSLFAFDELGRGSKNLWKTKLFFNSLI